MEIKTVQDLLNSEPTTTVQKAAVEIGKTLSRTRLTGLVSKFKEMDKVLYTTSMKELSFEEVFEALKYVKKLDDGRNNMEE